MNDEHWVKDKRNAEYLKNLIPSSDGKEMERAQHLIF